MGLISHGLHLPSLCCSVLGHTGAGSWQNELLLQYLCLGAPCQATSDSPLIF